MYNWIYFMDVDVVRMFQKSFCSALTSPLFWTPCPGEWTTSLPQSLCLPGAEEFVLVVPFTSGSVCLVTSPRPWSHWPLAHSLLDTGLTVIWKEQLPCCLRLCEFRFLYVNFLKNIWNNPSWDVAQWGPLARTCFKNSSTHGRSHCLTLSGHLSLE